MKKIILYPLILIIPFLTNCNNSNKDNFIKEYETRLTKFNDTFNKYNQVEFLSSDYIVIDNNKVGFDKVRINYTNENDNKLCNISFYVKGNDTPKITSICGESKSSILEYIKIEEKNNYKFKYSEDLNKNLILKKYSNEKLNEEIKWNEDGYIIEKSSFDNDNEYVIHINYKTIDYSSITVSCMGDSITYGTAPTGGRIETPYPEGLKEVFKFKNVFNYGIPGSTVSNGVKSYKPMVDRLPNIDPSSNFIIFYGGGNDRGRWCDTGNEGDTDPANLYGALYQVANMMTTTFKNMKSTFITPLPTKLDQGTYHQVRDAVVYTANKFNIPVLDMFYDKEFPKEWEEEFSDYIHPSQNYVSNVLTPTITTFIKDYIKF